MNDDQLYGFFAVPRNEDGSPNLPNPFAESDGLTSEGVYKWFLWKNGITDKAKQAELWKQERARRAGRAANRETEQAAGGLA